MGRIYTPLKYKFDIGDIIINDFRNITILDRQIRIKEFDDRKGHHIYRKKYYQYKCNICGKIDWVQEQAFNDEKRDFHICKQFCNFQYEMNQHIKDKKRDLIITNREYRKNKQNEKWYKYTCNICGWDNGWIKESNLKKGNGCACCAGKTVVKGINDIATTHPEIITYLVDKNDAYNHTIGDNELILCNCLECGLIKETKIYDIVRNGFSCPRCSDGISYPEKFIFSFLEQLKINFITQLSKNNFDWCEKYYYDFYFTYNNEQFIIETHGLQHYENKFTFYGQKNTFNKQKIIDKSKKEIAMKKGGIKEENYIVLDCRKSEMNYIINSIKNSKLNKLFDIRKVDFSLCNKYAMESKSIKVCRYYEEHKPISIKELAEIFKCSTHTIKNYLYKGTGSGLIKYNSNKQKIEQIVITGYKNGKQVEVFDLQGNSLGIFNSCSDLARQSINLFGVQFDPLKIAAVCRGEQKTHRKLYTFKYIN